MGYDPNSPLPVDQEGLLQAILQTLQAIHANTGYTDPAKRMRVAVETAVALPANQSINIAQINGVAPSTGAGGSGTGSQRVTPGSDTVSGNPNVYQMQMDANRVGVQTINSFIVTS